MDDFDMAPSLKNWGYPIGWQPQSMITWNGSWLPYSLRITDQVPGIGKHGTRDDADICYFYDITNDSIKEYPSRNQAGKILGLNVHMKQVMRGRLIMGRYFVYGPNNQPTEKDIARIKEINRIYTSFGGRYDESAGKWIFP